MFDVARDLYQINVKDVPVTNYKLLNTQACSFNMVWNRGCTQSLVVRCRYWVVPLVFTKVSGNCQGILLSRVTDKIFMNFEIVHSLVQFQAYVHNFGNIGYTFCYKYIFYTALYVSNNHHICYFSQPTFPITNAPQTFGFCGQIYLETNVRQRPLSGSYLAVTRVMDFSLPFLW